MELGPDWSVAQQRWVDGRGRLPPSGDRVVKAHQPLDIMLKREFIFDPGPRSAAHDSALIGVAITPLDRIAKGISVPSGNNPPLLPIQDAIGRAGQIRGDDRQPRGHRFQELLGEPLGDRRKNEEI